MPEYLAPGVYIQEIEIGAKPIEGVSTSTAGFLGETERGPLKPRLITGMEQWRRLYGVHAWITGENEASTSYLPYGVEGFFRNGGKRCYVARILGEGAKPAKLEIEPSGSPRPAPAAATTPGQETTASETEGRTEQRGTRRRRSGSNPGPALTVTAIGPGSWGNRIAIKIGPASSQSKGLFKLVVSYPHTGDMKYDVQEEYDELSSNPTSPSYFEKQINGRSSLIVVERGSELGQAEPKHVESETLENGTDGNKIGRGDYTGRSMLGERTGLAAFQEIDEISIVCAPNENDYDGLSDAVVSHCEKMKDRFAILQAPAGAAVVENVRPAKDSKYAAFYYPWVKVMDIATGTPKLVPPGGHIAGIYARSDAERGVFKAPANEVIRGVIGLEFNLTSEQDILNPRGVNCIRAFRGRGIRVWGARTTSSDPLWKYINVRRLFLYLEESIEEGTQWVVFEPNNERLWARTRQTVSDYLTTVWKAGGLMGNTPDDAFFVKCDETTMTPNDIENGRLVVLIGVAPVRPAEFVIFKIAQWRSGSEVTE